MFTDSAHLYDRFYSWKSYPLETDNVQQILTERVQSGGRNLLDIACGTGVQLVHLSQNWQITGVDLGKEILAVAQERLPAAEFIQSDMRRAAREGKSDTQS